MSIKKFLLAGAISLSLIWGCKKEDSLVNAKTNILGTWYAQSYDLGYYSNTEGFLSDVSTPSSALANDPPMIFNSDFTLQDGSKVFDYSITRGPKVDSLTYNGHTYVILSLTKDQLMLRTSFSDGQLFTNGTQEVSSSFAIGTSTFSRVKFSGQ